MYVYVQVYYMSVCVNFYVTHMYMCIRVWKDTGI